MKRVYSFEEVTYAVALYDELVRCGAITGNRFDACKVSGASRLLRSSVTLYDDGSATVEDKDGEQQ